MSIPDAILSLVPEYLAAKSGQIQEARTSLATRDFDSVRRFGHNLKGTGRGYGFPAMEDLGKEIESAATQRDEARIASQLDNLARFVAESQAVLQ